MKKICTIILCLMMLFAYIPAGMADEAPASNNADLSSLTVAGAVYCCDLVPAFDAATTAYTVDIPNEESSVDITATTSDANATLTIGGTAAASGVAHTVSELAVGANNIDVEVTAQDGTTVKTYTITINRAAAESAPLPQTPANYAASDYAKYAARMAAGYAHIAVINANGAIEVGGDNTYGQCDIPDGLKAVKVKAVAAGSYHTLALTEDGSVFAWGSSLSDSSGNKTLVSIPSEVEAVQGNIKLVAAGSSMSAVVTNSNQVIVWGFNSNQLETIPQGMGNIIVIGLTNNCAVVLNGEGNIIVWGDNCCASVPDGLNGNAVAITVGQYHWLALKKDGTVSVTGSSNMLQQCGNIANQTDVRAIAGGWQFAGAILADGSVKGWGRIPGGNFNTDGCEIISADANIRAFTCTVLGGIGSRPAICAMQGDGAIKIVAPSEFIIAPITDEFNFLTAPGNNADLSGLEVTGYTLVPAFDAATTAYTVDVPNGVSSADITATTADASATLTIGGTVAVSGVMQTISGLVVGANNIDVEVTAQDGTTVKTYTITINKAASADDNKLAVLTVESVVYSGGGPQVTTCGIYPKFDSDQTEGIVDVANAVTEVRITAQPSSGDATLEINGAPAVAGVAAVISADNLSVGDNLIPIKVTAANGNQRSYTLHVKRVSADYKLPALPQTPQAYQESEYAKYARRIAAGANHSLALKKNGAVVAWGQGSYGQCNVPAGFGNIVALAAGESHSMALSEDGAVVAWGSNNYGQSTVPDGLSNVVAISANSNFSAALDKNGKVYVWGDNNYGQCDVPADLSDVVDIQCGSRHILALKKDGTVKAWGSNWFGQCDVPTGLDHVMAIAAGFRHSMVLKDDGTLVAWGKYSNNKKFETLNLEYVKAIAAGENNAAALKWDGSLDVWGRGYGGENVNLGVPLELPQKILAIRSTYDHMLALNEDGTVTGWGENSLGQCNVPKGLNLLEDDKPPYNGPSPAIPQTPAAYAASSYVKAKGKICHTAAGWIILNMDGIVRFISNSDRDFYNLAQLPEGLNNVNAIASALCNIMAMQKDGQVVVWGLNDDGQCNAPETAHDITGIWSTKNMNNCCLALRNDGALIAWGNNSYGQRQVPEGLNDVTDIAAGYDHFLALKADGTVVAWGKNDCGQCDVPEGLNDVARVFANCNYSLALKNDGTVVAWGSNEDVNKIFYCGQCDVPEGLSGVVDISLEEDTCIALKNNGTAVVWGRNTYGKRNVPPDLHDVAAVSIGLGGAIVTKTDGSVECWGHLNEFDEDIFTSLSNVLTMSNDNIIIFRDGTLQYYDLTPEDNDTINAVLNGLNVLSGHYFNIASVELLDPTGNSVSAVPRQGGYRIHAGIDNNYASPADGLAIIQVRGGNGATSGGGGQVLGCVGISSLIPVTGSTVCSDFTMPAGISGPAYVDVFVWDNWDNMVPRAEASQDLSFTVTE
ncbi:MAG: cadherin-like beta sandwich domain-containing protein [Eubacteriales bacterium]